MGDVILARNDKLDRHLGGGEQYGKTFEIRARRLQMGVTPYWRIHHGLTLSF
jgi:hypothetical protein